MRKLSKLWLLILLLLLLLLLILIALLRSQTGCMVELGFEPGSVAVELLTHRALPSLIVMIGRTRRATTYQTLSPYSSLSMLCPAQPSSALSVHQDQLKSRKKSEVFSLALLSPHIR